MKIISNIMKIISKTQKLIPNSKTIVMACKWCWDMPFLVPGSKKLQADEEPNTIRLWLYEAAGIDWEKFIVHDHDYFLIASPSLLMINHRKQFGGEMIALLTDTFFQWSLMWNSFFRWSLFWPALSSDDLDLPAFLFEGSMATKVQNLKPINPTKMGPFLTLLRGGGGAYTFN